MRRPLRLFAFVALALAADACALDAPRPIPPGADDRARYLLLPDQTSTDCGKHVATLPPTGRIPPPDTNGLLLALPAFAAPDRSIAVYRIDAHHPFAEAGLVALPAPVHAWRIQAGRYGDADLQTAAAAAVDLRALIADPPECAQAVAALCGATSPCVQLAAVGVRIDGEAAFVLPLDDSRALTVTREGTRAIASRDGSLATDRVGAGTPWASATRTADGAIWTFGPGGRLARGSAEGPFIALPALPDAELGGWSEIDGDGLFAVTSSLAIGPGLLKGAFTTIAGRFDGTAWTKLTVASDLRTGRPWIQALGPTSARAFIGAEIVAFSGGAVDRETLPLSSSDQVWCWAFTPSLGTVVGTESGELWHEDTASGTARWTKLDSPGEQLQLATLVPFGDGFIFSPENRNGLLRQYIADYGLCESQVILSGGPFASAPMPGGGIVVLSRMGASSFISFADRKHPYPSCFSAVAQDQSSMR